MTQSENSILRNIFFNQEFENLRKFEARSQSEKAITIEEIKEFNVNPCSEVEGEKLSKRINELKPALITTSVLWGCILSEFKWDILLSYSLKQMECLLRVALSFVISLIFDNFESNQKWKCYVFAGVTGIIWILMAILDQSCWKNLEQSSLRIKGSLTYALYLKTLTLSNFNLNGSQRGEIINAIIEFHDILENQTNFIFIALSAPLAIIGLTSLLVHQIGWIAIAGVSLSLLCEFIHYHYASYNTRFYSDVSKFKDERVQILTEVISAFRYIKMQVWEKLFIDKISKIRDSEMKGFVKYGAGRSLEIALSEGISTASMLLIIGVTAKINDSLTSKIIISAILNILLIKLLIIYSSYGISCYYQINSLMDRVASVFAKEPIQPLEFHQEENLPSNDPNDKRVVIIEKLWCSYDEDIENQSILRDLSLSIEEGEFIGIFGEVGSGKSTFLNTLVNQIPHIKGRLTISKQMAFHESEPALFTGTIEENIRFGKTMTRQLYDRAIKYSCLDSDLSHMPLRDQTVIEEGAVNLSGGQRTRLCLARVIYSNQSILLLDDPLSSLDSRVISKIIQNLVNLSVNERKTIILVTHQIQSLLKCNRCIEIKGKSFKIFTQQQFSQLEQNFVENQSDQLDCVDDEEKILLRKQSLLSKKQSIAQQQQFAETALCSQQKILVPRSGFIITIFSYAFKNKWNYLVFPLTLLCYTISQTLYGILVLFLNDFDSIRNGTNSTFSNENSLWTALSIMSPLIFIFQMFRTFLLNLTIQLANKALQKIALSHIFKSSILALDKLGTKGILDKFSTDLGLLDVSILSDLSGHFIVSFIAIIQMIIIATVNPIILIFAFVMIIPLYIWYSYCSKVVSIMKDMDLNEKGPVISFFSESLNGLVQIKNMHAQEYMTHRLTKVLNNSILLGVNFRKIFRVFVAYTAYYSLLVIIGGYFALIAMNDSSNFENFTFAAVFLVEINQCILFSCSLAIKINSNLVSIDRILSLTNLRTEAEFQTVKPEKKMLMESEIKLGDDNTEQPQFSIFLRNVSLRYDAGDKLALNKISISMKAGQKVALIGRTGSGKSSIIQALYRLVELQPQSVFLIQGENALDMSIEALRLKLTCIPQVPFIFTGTLRSNLDPFQKFTDEAIIDVLKKIGIYQFVQQSENGLNTLMTSGEMNLSGGQKQLLCLARALLEKKKFLILDEATSNIDHKTDEIIQKLLRQEFEGKTIIVVAHRLKTILDFNLIVVLSKGEIVEMGTAQELWQKKGEFHSMIDESGDQRYQLMKALERQEQ